MSTIRKVYIPETPPVVKCSDVLHYLGYGNNKPDEATIGLVESCIKELYTIMSPKCVYASFPIKFIDNRVVLDNCQIRLTGLDIAKHLKGCSVAVLIAATLSAQTDKLIRRMQSKDLTSGVIMDSCATAAVEQLCDDLENEIKSQFSDCFFTTRYSPGYGDLPLELQRDFLSTLDAPRSIGLCANDTFILTPRKSVTAVIGVGSNPSSSLRTGCDFCRIRNNCWFKKRGVYCGLSKSAE